MSKTQRGRRILFPAIVAGVAALAVGALAGGGSESPYARLGLFARVLAKVEALYVEPVDQQRVIEGAIQGMVGSLDPHSAFLLPEDFAILDEDTRGRFGGVGLEVGARDGALEVITPIAGSPAEAAGIRAGDRIVRIGTRSTREMGIFEAVKLMRGPTGTEVTISIERDGAEGLIEVTLVREVIEVVSVESELIAPGFPWIRVRAFQDGTAADVDEAIGRLSARGGGLQGVLLDLRRNPGGVLQEAVRLADLFLVDGPIVSTRGRGGEVLQLFEAGRWGTYDDVPLVLLVDRASASAAEIVAGALQDHGRAVLVGTRTFGKGSVQSIIQLEQGYGLKLTIARYYTPNGRSIQAEGIAPDVLVESLTPPEPDEESRALEKIGGERELPGHLAGGGQRTEDPEPDYEDYQVRMGFQVLRGLARTRAGTPER